MSVGPNPGNGLVRIVSGNAELAMVRITTTAGKQIASYNITGGYEYNADLRKFPDGLYLILIRVKDREQEYSFKYIKRTIH